KNAQERDLPTRTPTALRESHRRLHCHLILAEGGLTDGPDGSKPAVTDGSQRTVTDGSQPAVKARDDVSVAAEVSSRDVDGEDSLLSWGRRAEALAREAVELIPGDHRPWEALGEACDAQGAAKASDAADAWSAVLDRMEEAWGKGGGGPVPPLRVYMRLGSLYNSLGRTEEAKACFLRACRAWRAPGPWLGCGVACLRLEQWQEAEDALQHASRLDCNSPLVWGHLALLLLSMGEDR
ncbi:unnamed protein product, partial [Laminaria digitata]